MIFKPFENDLLNYKRLYSIIISDVIVCANELDCSVILGRT